MILTIIIVFVAIIYFILLIQWNLRLLCSNKGVFVNHSDTFISVVIPFRNEEKNLDVLLTGIKSISEKSNNFEVIFVDDHSDDSSRAIIQKYMDANGNVSLYCNDEHNHGKKKAIHKGITHAKGDYIYTVDADCILKDTLIDVISSYVNSNSPDLLILPVAYLCSSWFHRLQQVEFYSLQATTAATALGGDPMMCNGANLIFGKTLYLDYMKSSYGSDYASGDDMFILDYAVSTKRKVQYLFDSSALIYTYPVNRFKDFMVQRARWVGKMKGLRNFKVSLLSWLIFLSGLYPVILFSNDVYKYYSFFSILTIKAILEYLFINQFAIFSESRIKIIDFLTVFIAYPFYLIFVTFLALFPVKIAWKGRKTK